jgi:hypothetical protein
MVIITDLKLLENPGKFKNIMRNKEHRRINLVILETLLFKLCRGYIEGFTQQEFETSCDDLHFYDHLIRSFWHKWIDSSLIIGKREIYSFNDNSEYRCLVRYSSFTIDQFKAIYL